jgi:hypothetical protein
VMSTYVVSSLPSGAGNPWGTRYCMWNIGKVLGEDRG